MTARVPRGQDEEEGAGKFFINNVESRVRRPKKRRAVRIQRLDPGELTKSAAPTCQVQLLAAWSLGKWTLPPRGKDRRGKEVNAWLSCLLENNKGGQPGVPARGTWASPLPDAATGAILRTLLCTQ
jgi:hypothetical protein